MTHKLGMESVSTARRIEFHQRSCNSAIGQRRFSPFSEIRRSLLITDPIRACGMFVDFNCDKICSAFSGSHVTMMRDCASLNNMAHVSKRRFCSVAAAYFRDASSSRFARPWLQRSICAPSEPSGLKQHSASVTAKPPSLQSCALVRRPSRIKLRTAFCTAISSLRSSFGTGPSFLPKQTFRKRDPPRL